MAILSTTKATLLQGDASFESATSSRSDIYQVFFDAKPADQDDVIAQFMAYEELAYGDIDGSSSRVLKAFKPSSLGTVTEFIVEVSYETPESQDGSASDPNPLVRPDEVTISGSGNSRPYFKDHSDEPKLVVNTAGEPFQKLPERYHGSFEIVIRGNRASLDPVTWVPYVHPIDGCAINSDSITIRGISFSPGQLLMKSIRSTRRTENGTTYNEMEWTIAVAPDWDDKIESRGFFELADGELYQIYADNGKDPVTMPYPLQESGEAATSPDAEPYAITFKPYKARPFSIFTFSSAA